ncbi:MAG: helix-turn-helix domain-containing protein [Phycisphaerales bacterium JB043]
MHWFPAHPYALGMTPHQDLALELERLTHLVRAEAPDTDMQCSLDGVLASLKGSDFAPQADSEPPELRALRLLESRNSPSLPIGSIASRVFVDRSHLARQFQMRFGCSMQTYRVRIRLRQVAQDLLEGIGSIAESALNAGFYDQSHCTRFFTSEYGLPPETWFRTVRSLGFQGAT